MLKGVGAGWYILTHGPLAIFERQGAKAFGELLTAYRSQDNPWMHHMSPEKVIGPAILMGEYGKGRVVYLPFSLDSAFVGSYKMPEHRNLIRNIIRFLNPSPLLIIDAPPNIETVITKGEKRNCLIVHFLCFCGSPTSSSALFAEGLKQSSYKRGINSTFKRLISTR